MKRGIFITALAVFAVSILSAAGPNAPTDLRLEYTGGTTINLYWPAAVTNGAAIGGYSIYRTTAAAITYTAQLTDPQWGTYFYVTVPGAVTTYADPVGDTTQPYFYRIAPFDINNVEGPLGVTANAYPYPPAITGATGYNSRVVLTWAQSQDPLVTGYNVYRSTSPDILQASLDKISQTTEFFDSDTANLVTYYYRIGSLNNGSGAYSGATAAIPYALPFAPQSVSATVAGANVTLLWAASSAQGSYNISGYDIYRNASPTPVTFTTQATYTDLSLSAGATYNYSIVAQDINSNLSPPAYLSVYLPGQPSVPTGLTATTAVGSVILSWTANNSQENVTGYDVYRDSGWLANAQSNSYTDSTVNIGETHSYYVDSYNTSGTSAACNPINVIVLPAAPTGFNAVRSLTTYGAVDISWTANTDAISQYYLFRAVSPTAFNFSAAYITGIANSVTNYVDAAVTPGVTYNYCLSAYNTVTGSPSVSAPAKPALFPASAAVINAQPFNNMILLSWPAANPSYDPQGYNIYSSADNITYAAVTTQSTALIYPAAGLTNGQFYYFKVTTLNSYGESTTVNAYAVKISPYASNNPPFQVTNLYVNSPGDGTISLLWDPYIPGTGATAYNVYRSTISGVYTTPLVETTNNSYVSTSISTAAVATPVVVGTPYYFIVKAVGNSQEGPASAEGNTVPFYRPYPVSNLDGLAVNSQIILDWLQPSALGTYETSYKYRIYRSTSSILIDSSVNLLQDNYTSLTYADSGVNTAAGSYYYLVKSIDNYYNEDTSDSPLQIQFGAAQPAPPYIAAVAGANQVMLIWNNSLITAQYFNIYRSTQSGVYGAPVAYDVSFSTKNFTDTGLTNGTTYYYIVKAVNAMGEGPPSTEVSATPYTPLMVPAAPYNKVSVVQVNKKDALVSWYPVGNTATATFGLSGYNVYRSDDNGGTYNYGTPVAQTIMALSVTDTTTVWNTKYLYLVKAQDTAGNQDAVYVPGAFALPLPQNKIRVYRNLLNLSANQTLTMHYYITEAGHLRIRIYTLSGEFVNELIDTQITDALSADNPFESQPFYWDGTNRAGKKVASGLYLISMEIGADRVIEKIAVVR